MSDRVQFVQLATPLLRRSSSMGIVLTYLAGVGIEAAFHSGGFFRAYKLPTPVGVVIFTVGTILAAWGAVEHEEERLHAVFGGEYQQYQNGVRRWL